MKMPSNLHMTYWILITISVLSSSCFLCLVVATENAKNAAVTTTTTTLQQEAAAPAVVGIEKVHHVAAAARQHRVEQPATTTTTNVLPLTRGIVQLKTKILPNYKKVKKLTTTTTKATKTSDKSVTSKAEVVSETTATDDNLKEKLKNEAPALEENVKQQQQQQQQPLQSSQANANACDMPDDVASTIEEDKAATADSVNDDDGEVINKVPKLDENIRKVKKSVHHNDEQQQQQQEHHNDDQAAGNADGDPQHDSDVKVIESVHSEDSVLSEYVNLLNELAGDEEDGAEKAEVSKQKTETEQKEADLDASNSGDSGLPDIITEIPTVTITELPIEFLEPTQNPLDVVLLDASKENAQDQENKTFKYIEITNEDIKKTDQIVKINDSGGGSDSDGLIELSIVVQPQQQHSKEADDSNIPANDSLTATTATVTTANTGTQTGDSGEVMPPADTQQQQQQQEQQQQNTTSTKLNLTAEEVPIPVFSEWAQKQMEAAEKQEALEQEQQVVNNSAQRRNHTNGNGKLPIHKIRSKNYASPDCGAKIIASNADATNTGAVLSSSKDEYMLSPCGNRIWFVVELCEAIQAQKIDLANFELFSSSPKNFTVAVSNRFPTRDWSNVGRFIAEDKRTVQSFDLHPHLFGKFVRVDIHSHYSKEHFCPVSLFRVFGTSEFEAFETENDPNDDMDDFDEEFPTEQAHVKNSENNLFKSASDAVLSIVKKAAEVLAKPSASKEKQLLSQGVLCQSPAFGPFSCADCNQTLVERINNMLSCELPSLRYLLHISHLQKDLTQTRICLKEFGIDTKLAAQQNDCSLVSLTTSNDVDAKSSYYLNILPFDYVGALCQLFVEQQNLRKLHNSTRVGGTGSGDAQTQALNLTIDKKVRDNFQINMTQEKKLITPDTPTGAAGATAGTPPSKDGNAEKIDATPSSGAATTTAATPTTPSPTTESATRETEEQIVRPPAAHLLEEQQQQTVQATTTTTAPMQTTTTAATTPPTIAATTQQMPADKTAPDVNIFNVPDDTTIEQQPEMVVLTTSTTEMPYQSEQDAGSTENSAYASSTMPGHIQIASSESTDPSSWENFDNMLTTTVPTVATTGGAGGGGGAAANGNQPNTNGVNLQQRLPTGGPQSESVFIRLSNRIKALERNMSLSGQYLEELSRRYKKQVEELHQILNQQTQNVRTLEEQSRRHTELEQIYAQRNTQLKDELEDLRLQIHACVIVIIFVGGFLFLVLIIGILFYRAIYRKTKVLLSAGNSMRGQSQSSSNTTSLQSKPSNLKKAKRRKSFEDYPEPVAKAGTGDGGAGGMQSEKERRPSEEAMLILKQCSLDGQQQAAPQRQRKVSVFYGSGEQLLDTKSSSSSSGTKQSSKRKGEKHSWPSTQQQQKDRQSMQEGAGSLPRPRLAAGESAKPVKSKKKAQQQLFKRQESAPASSTIHERLNNSAPAACSTISDYDENLILDEDDLDNFLPNADLVYNEFMPDGPSGYQIANELAQQQQLQLQKQQQLLKPTKKSRRLSSPAFFKSPFGKNLKIKPKQHTPPHESTSWEWYRLSKNNQHNKAASGGGSAPATANLDTTSLSEINFPTDSTQNSYRILEEAILMSGESAMTARLNENNNGKKSAALASSGVMELNNGKRKGVGVVKSNSSVNSSSSSSGSVSNSSSSSGSNRSSCNGSCSNPSSTSSSSSCSNSTKKIKNRSLHNIFRKVF